MSVMAPHRFHRSIGTQSDKGERLGRFVLNGVYGYGTERIGYRCYAADELLPITTSLLHLSYFLLRAYTHHIALRDLGKISPTDKTVAFANFLSVEMRSIGAAKTIIVFI